MWTTGQTLTIAHAITGVPNDLTADATSTLVINGSGAGVVIPASLPALLLLVKSSPPAGVEASQMLGVLRH